MILAATRSTVRAPRRSGLSTSSLRATFWTRQSLSRARWRGNHAGHQRVEPQRDDAALAAARERAQPAERGVWPNSARSIASRKRRRCLRRGLARERDRFVELLARNSPRRGCTSSSPSAKPQAADGRRPDRSPCARDDHRQRHDGGGIAMACANAGIA